MAFIYNERDSVSFYIKASFAKDNKIITQLIERGDEDSLLYFIHLYMEKTNSKSSLATLAVRRPSTPSLNKLD